VRRIDQSPFLRAQSGKLKQHYGARVNFNKRKINPSAFRGLPDYVHWIDARLRRRVEEEAPPADSNRDSLRAALARFEPTDAFVLRYHARDASNLDFHRDDEFAYGEVILDLSLETDSVLTFAENPERGEPGAPPTYIRIPLPARSLAVLHGPARFDWEHGVLAGDIEERRTSITLRTLGDSLRDSGAGRRILEVARSGRL
jgi:alkylated DNA repair dioxygenase AlkB